MEEFGLDSMLIVKALSPFPGFGGMGWMCGGATGGLAAIGFFLGSEDLRNDAAVAATMKTGKRLMMRFENKLGAVTCRKIHEDVVFGCFMDPGASPENMQTFAKAGGFEKCSLVAGIGARLAAEVIIERPEAGGSMFFPEEVRRAKGAKENSCLSFFAGKGFFFDEFPFLSRSAR